MRRAPLLLLGLFVLFLGTASASDLSNAVETFDVSLFPELEPDQALSRLNAFWNDDQALFTIFKLKRYGSHFYQDPTIDVEAKRVEYQGSFFGANRLLLRVEKFPAECRETAGYRMILHMDESDKPISNEVSYLRFDLCPQKEHFSGVSIRVTVYEEKGPAPSWKRWIIQPVMKSKMKEKIRGIEERIVEYNKSLPESIARQ